MNIYRLLVESKIKHLLSEVQISHMAVIQCWLHIIPGAYVSRKANLKLQNTKYSFYQLFCIFFINKGKDVEDNI